MFQPVSSRVNLPELEEKILKLWKENKIFERSIEGRRNAPRFTLYEGPPTANGNPGIHHVLARVFKDVIPRYKTMKGFYAPRQAGWDTHGLPVELEVEKSLGFTRKTQIEEYGIEKFNAKCKESVFKYLQEWEQLTERIGYWTDLGKAYRTMDNDYIESGWWAIKQMWDAELIYQGYRVTPHCPRCGTSLSSHEVALGYQDNTEDPSVFIKFKVADVSLDPWYKTAAKCSYCEGEVDFIKWLTEFTHNNKVYFLAWTTTPWTLPGNAALAVSPGADYVFVELNGEYLILAAARLESAGLAQCPVIKRVKGEDLLNVRYEPLFKVPIGYSPTDKPAHRIISGDFVSMDDGTGIVHIAPAYGEIDFDIGEKEGLPLIHDVDLGGIVMESPSGTTPRYRAEVISGKAAPMPEMKVDLPGKGKFVKKADKEIMADLESRGLVFRAETVRHTYPFCWRCGTPLLYYAKRSWYIKTTARKEDLIKNNEKINWYPEHIKEGRFGDWLKNNVDWAFSRERYWGTPLPVWYCASCKRYECAGSVADLKSKPGAAALLEEQQKKHGTLDLHRPFIDDITYACPQCGGTMKREPEVIDCWFDSGNMPIAQYHYPFDNKTMFEDGRFPADYICEAMDQTRGWFYSLHAISTLLFNQPSYKNCICLGLVLDEKGEKMSKSRGNVVKPFAILSKYGADTLRWYCLTSNPPGNVRRFSEKTLVEMQRQLLMTLWNVYSFFVTYANIDNFNPATAKKEVAFSELDRWINSELNQLNQDIDNALASYDPTSAGRKVEEFVDELSNWYVRRSRRRFWKSESDADKLAAYTTLYNCLVMLAKLMAPFTPFIAEELYQNLVRPVYPDAPESVHMTDFPAADVSKIDSDLSTATKLVMKVASLGRAARAKAAIKVRQPMAEVIVKVNSAREQEILTRLETQVLDELNVKKLRTTTNQAELELSGFTVVTEGEYSASVPNEVPPELAEEGMAREIVHRLQTMRRSADFDIADHIIMFYQGDDYVKQVMANFGDYIKQETLATEVIEGPAAEDAFKEDHKLVGHEVHLGVKRA